MMIGFFNAKIQKHLRLSIADAMVFASGMQKSNIHQVFLSVSLIALR